MLKKSVIVLIVIATIYTSCQKDQIEPVLFKNQSSTTSDNSDKITEKIDSTYELPIKETKKGGILSASSARDIPSQFFKVDSRYRERYQHMKQPNGSSCSWTSYVITAACIIKGNCNWCSYPVNKDKVYSVRNWCGYSSYIKKLESYAQSNDKYKIIAESKSTGNRFEAIKIMLNQIYNNHCPFLVIGTYYKCDDTQVGHYLIVHSIKWTQKESSSTVYYTDCSKIDRNGTSFDDNLKSLNLSTFLDQMIDCPNNYNMLLMKPTYY